ncbi:sensor histidine kinase [Sphingomonas sp. CGMCC 1.13654]|uniref:Sensor histidine kinase n=1 Tax=Sphingomonas chungangi TaxID=2683589 RepID=A0A838L6M9_9SPHN|nr:ATP-binding protein [Sphingomonas chungangi]MBA2934312.1 sensor histidine kinase [Sphingomonas chungangi]MVW57353.1 hypothetical protein [Sphingomonas chungangi]
MTLDVSLARETLRINGDANLLGQVLLNLPKNAWQACRGASSPAMAVRVDTNEADRVVISVSDNGPGVPSRLAQEIFLPSSRPRRAVRASD